MHAMNTISLALVLLTLQASCWSRRRRTGDETSAKRFRTRTKRLVVSSEEMHLEKDRCLYTRKSEMCGIQLSCACCSVPTFGGCHGGNMIGYQYGMPNELTSGQGQDELINEIADEMEHKLSDGVLGEREDRLVSKECTLYRTKFLGNTICLPWNFLAITDILDVATDGDCSVILPNRCGTELDPHVEYWASFIIGAEHAPEAERFLHLAGHNCSFDTSKSEMRCVL